jgi:hypothetical protein
MVHAPKVEKVGNGRKYSKLLCLNECLGLAHDRAAIFFRKVEFRQTADTDLVCLLSSLEALWSGKRGPLEEQLGGKKGAGGKRRHGAASGSKSKVRRHAGNRGREEGDRAHFIVVCRWAGYSLLLSLQLRL